MNNVVSNSPWTLCNLDAVQRDVALGPILLLRQSSGGRTEAPWRISRWVGWLFNTYSLGFWHYFKCFRGNCRDVRYVVTSLRSLPVSFRGMAHLCESFRGKQRWVIRRPEKAESLVSWKSWKVRGDTSEFELSSTGWGKGFEVLSSLGPGDSWMADCGSELVKQRLLWGLQTLCTSVGRLQRCFEPLKKCAKCCFYVFRQFNSGKVQLLRMWV